MKLVLSRKGFDNSAGGFPSPIVDGAPTSLPIPARSRSRTSYDDLGLGALVERATAGRIAGASLCHHDPMFEDGRCAFGQAGAAQTHLDNQGVTIGDVFLFFGLFARPDGRDPHHRIFGYLRVTHRHRLGPDPREVDQPAGFPAPHPHVMGSWPRNNTLWLGQGRTAVNDDQRLRLSRIGGPISRWRVPRWLRRVGLTYHSREDRWTGEHELRTVGRGQEFVADITASDEALMWVGNVIDAIGGRTLALRCRNRPDGL